MPLTQSRHEGQTRLQISGSFTIFQAADYKAQLLQQLEFPDELLKIDLRAVEEIDTAGLQLLLLLRREALARNKRLEYDGISQVVENMIEMLQLQHIFSASHAARREPE